MYFYQQLLVFNSVALALMTSFGCYGYVNGKLTSRVAVENSDSSIANNSKSADPAHAKVSNFTSTTNISTIGTLCCVDISSSRSSLNKVKIGSLHIEMDAAEHSGSQTNAAGTSGRHTLEDSPIDWLKRGDILRGEGDAHQLGNWSTFKVKATAGKLARQSKSPLSRDSKQRRYWLVGSALRHRRWDDDVMQWLKRSLIQAAKSSSDSSTADIERRVRWSHDDVGLFWLKRSGDYWSRLTEHK